MSERGRRVPASLYAVAALAAAAVFASGAGRAWGLERELYWIRGLGWGALIALASCLSATPLGALLRRRGHASARDVARTRRALGICAAALATLHGVVSMSTYLADAWSVTLELSWIRSGALAWSILLALWLTSFPGLVRRLRIELWKPLQRLAYVAFALAAHHALTSPFARRGWVLAIVAVVGALAALRLLRRRPKAPRPRPGSG